MGVNGNSTLYDLIKETFLLLDFGDRRILEQFRLSVPRYYALTHIATEPGISPSQLSRYMFCDKSNITRLLQSLEDGGLVERRPHTQDGRVHRLFLTTNGEALYRGAAEAHRQAVTHRLATLDGDESRRVAKFLVTFNRSLSEGLDDAGKPSVN
jgi:DNA-binding MarR family transcriptional regulator